jgi:hypothetical protein
MYNTEFMKESSSHLLQLLKEENTTLNRDLLELASVTKDLIMTQQVPDIESAAIALFTTGDMYIQSEVIATIRYGASMICAASMLFGEV